MTDEPIERLSPVEPSPVYLYVLHERDGTIAGDRRIAQRLTPGEYIRGDDGRRFLLFDAGDVPPGHHFTNPEFDGYAVLAEAL